MYIAVDEKSNDGFRKRFAVSETEFCAPFDQAHIEQVFPVTGEAYEVLRWSDPGDDPGGHVVAEPVVAWALCTIFDRIEGDFFRFRGVYPLVAPGFGNTLEVGDQDRHIALIRAGDEETRKIIEKEHREWLDKRAKKKKAIDSEPQ